MSEARAKSRAENAILDMASTMATVLCLVMSKCSIGCFRRSDLRKLAMTHCTKLRKMALPDQAQPRLGRSAQERSISQKVE